MSAWQRPNPNMATAMATIDEQAAHWAVRLERAPLSPAEQRAFDAWVAADPRHQGALIRARAQWADLDRVAALAPGGLPAFAGTRPEPKANSTARRAVAAGLGFIAALGAGIWFMTSERGDVYASELGEVRRVSLDDGSQMLLNTSSKAIVDFSDGTRRVRLEYGEAVFDVAPDKARPFVVTTSDVTVTAVGTEFAVRVKNTGVAVTVTEGVVELQRRNNTLKERAQRLEANRRADIVAAEPTMIAAVDAATAKRRLAWRDGMVSFDGDTAAVAIAEINRYNRRKVVLDDAALGSQPIIGYFRTSDVDGFARALAAAFDGGVRKDGDTVRIVTAPPAR
jgi:transmembrane sensor